MLQPYPKLSIRKSFKKNKSLFIPFIMAGHPSLEMTSQALKALADNGADIIELGIPFSDSIADGPINQKAAEIALHNGTTLEKCLELIRCFREDGYLTPIILFSYLNPLLAMGIDAFAQKAKEVGINGVLIVDLPVGAENTIYETLLSYQLEPILLASPTTDLKRLALYKNFNPGFVYYISRLGVTGIQNALADDLLDQISPCKAQLGDIPLACGFGISSKEQAQAVAKMAQGVIVGSLLVKKLEDAGIAGLSQLAKELSGAIQDF